MKVAYFINTFKSSNWGGQATSNGVKYLLENNYPNMEFVPLDLPDLPFKKNKLLRVYYDYKLREALLKDDEKSVFKYLEKMNIKSTIFDSFSHICFNGEGAVHYKSGHLVRFMALLYLAKKKNKYVASINQTIDLNNNRKFEKLLSFIYNKCDFVSVREPISFEYARNIGIEKCKLVPDAVYGLKKFSKEEISRVLNEFDIKSKYITITASSVLKRNKKNIKLLENILDCIKEIFPSHQLIFMSNAKTDFYLAKKLLSKFNMKIITSDEINYDKAIAIFAGSDYLIGGRQHPNIFAYIYNVPYLPFEGNTFKNHGVAQLQNYDVNILSFDNSKQTILDNLQKLKSTILDKSVTIDNFRIFDEID